MKTYPLNTEDKELVEKAEKLWKKYHSKKHPVAARLITKSGKIFDGMSMEFDCGIGICAERVAMFKMMPEETEIKTIVASSKNKVIPPCGVCRELMYQMNKKNIENTWVILSKKEKAKLGDIYQFTWEEILK